MATRIAMGIPKRKEEISASTIQRREQQCRSHPCCGGGDTKNLPVDVSALTSTNLGQNLRAVGGDPLAIGAWVSGSIPTATLARQESPCHYASTCGGRLALSDRTSNDAHASTAFQVCHTLPEGGGIGRGFEGTRAGDTVGTELHMEGNGARDDMDNINVGVGVMGQYALDGGWRQLQFDGMMGVSDEPTNLDDLGDVGNEGMWTWYLQLRKG